MQVVQLLESRKNKLELIALPFPFPDNAVMNTTNPPTHLPTYLPTYQPLTNLPTYLPTYQHTYPPANIPTYQPTYLFPGNNSIVFSVGHAHHTIFLSASQRY